MQNEGTATTITTAEEEEKSKDEKDEILKLYHAYIVNIFLSSYIPKHSSIFHIINIIVCFFFAYREWDVVTDKGCFLVKKKLFIKLNWFLRIFLSLPFFLVLLSVALYSHFPSLCMF